MVAPQAEIFTIPHSFFFGKSDLNQENTKISPASQSHLCSQFLNSSPPLAEETFGAGSETSNINDIICKRSLISDRIELWNAEIHTAVTLTVKR